MSTRQIRKTIKKTKKKNVSNNNTFEINKKILALLDTHQLVGIGDFTHGCTDIPIFIKQLLDFIIKNTNKQIKLFTENSAWRCENIMKHSKLIYKKPLLWNNKWPSGKLTLYAGYGAESPECLELIKFIRKHRNRITIIGADPDIIDRDEAMAKTILDGLLPKNEGYNIWYAANHHVDTDKYEEMNQKWLPNPEIQRYFAGYHLCNKLGNEYCIILSQAYKGIVRYSGVCIGDDCEYRISNLDYIWKDFIIPDYKKYANKKTNISFYDKKEFNVDKLAIFNAPYHAGLKKIEPIGLSGGFYSRNTKNWNYILFFNEIHKLESI